MQKCIDTFSKKHVKQEAGKAAIVNSYISDKENKNTVQQE